MFFCCHQNQKTNSKKKLTCVSLLFLEYSRSACSRACSKNISLFVYERGFQVVLGKREGEKREKER